MGDASRHEKVRDLVWEWDPLREDDPADGDAARDDEYDWLVVGVERELDEGTDARRLAVYLTNAVRTQYGLDDPPPPDAIAERLAAL